MQSRSIVVGNQIIDYHLRSSRTGRLMRLAVYSDGAVLLTKPYRASLELAFSFLRSRSAWILEILKSFGKEKSVHRDSWDASKKACSRDVFLKNKAAARSLVLLKIKEINDKYGFSYGRIAIRNQSTRWGSCSRRGNLNFNYRILFLSDSLSEYIITHELCHLGEFNHSDKFWNLVAKNIPDYAARRQELRRLKLEV